MIEVTDEMREILMPLRSEWRGKAFDFYITQIIELHEESKPKPEPVGYIVQEAVQDNTFITGKACVMIRSKPSANSTVPVYTTQPAREPLSNEQIIEIADKTQTAESGVNGYILPIAYAREIEKAHGITE